MTNGAPFSNKTVVIVGASAGIGAEVARRFAAQGARLVLAARGAEKLNAFAESLKARGTQVLAIPMDLGSDADCRQLLETTVATVGGFDVLICNAALHHRGPVEMNEADDLARMVDVNLRAPIFLTRLALPHLRSRGGGTVVQVASLAGCIPTPGSATYSATKFGLRAFARALDDELRGSGIRIKVVSPGPVDTGFILDDLDRVTNLTLSQPMSTADDVAAAIVAITSDHRLERKMPWQSGLLTTLGYVAPLLGRVLRPLLERKGRNARERLRARLARPAR
jgi:short-subunit dehydrogenase